MAGGEEPSPQVVSKKRTSFVIPVNSLLNCALILYLIKVRIKFCFFRSMFVFSKYYIRVFFYLKILFVFIYSLREHALLGYLLYLCKMISGRVIFGHMIRCTLMAQGS